MSKLPDGALGDPDRLKATGKGEQSRASEETVKDCPPANPDGVNGKHLGKSGR